MWPSRKRVLSPAAVAAALILGVWIGLAAGCANPAPLQLQRQAGQQHLGKCVWVTRFEYKTQADIDRIMGHCAQAGFDTVFFQVRGQGTVFYSSHEEVWSETLGFASPGFDPLSHAVAAAHSQGLKLHAWLNMMPGWRGTKPPDDPRQLFRARPEWFLRRADGELDTEANYAWLNPCLPEVRSYLVRLCEEVAAGFGVDGVHLDYIRFPHSEARQSPGDERSRRLFTRQTGRPIGDTETFRRWKAGCVTELLRQVRRRLKRLPRPVLLTVAVNANMKVVREHVMQDWPGWAKERLVDAVVPMNYTHDEDLFLSRSRACVEAASGTPVVMGVGVYLHQKASLDPVATMKQMDVARRVGAAGVSLFSYQSAFDGKWQPAIAYWNRTRVVR